jgi:plasmid segregation protein ParM
MEYQTGFHNNGAGDMLMEIGGQKLFVGDLARRQSNAPRSPLGRERDLEFVKVMALAGLFSVGIHNANVNLVTGLPVAWYTDHDALEDALAGAHSYAVNGEPCEIDIQSVRTIPQPFGTLYREMIQDGIATDPHGYAHATVAIVDIGDGTTDFVVSKALEYMQHDSGLSGSIDVAAAEIYRHVQQQLREHHQAEYARREIEALLHTRSSVRIAGEEVSLTEFVAPALDFVAHQILDWMSEHWGNARQFEYLIITGGGANLLAKDIREAYPFSTRTGSPQIANAAGMAELAALHARNA